MSVSQELAVHVGSVLHIGCPDCPAVGAFVSRRPVVVIGYGSAVLVVRCPSGHSRQVAASAASW